MSVSAVHVSKSAEDLCKRFMISIKYLKCTFNALTHCSIVTSYGFTGDAIMSRLSQCQRSNPEEMGKIGQYLTTTKHNEWKSCEHTTASQITSLTIVYSTVYADADQRKHQSSTSLAFVRGIHRGPVNSPHKWPVTWKMFPFDDVIMIILKIYSTSNHAQ